LISNALIIWYDCHGCGVGIVAEGAPDYFNHIYTRPYTRIATYLVGIATAFILTELRNPSSRPVNKYLKVPSWRLLSSLVFAAFLMLSTVYGSYHGSSWDQRGFRTIAYMVFSRVAFTAGVAIFTLFFAMGYGGIMNSFLSLRIWDPFAKLTYGAYLIHPAVMRVYYYSQKQPISYSDLNISYIYIGHITTAYILSSYAYCMVEKPFMNLESIIIPRKKH